MSDFWQQKPADVFQASLVSAVIWIAMVIEYWLIANFLGLRLNLPETITALTALCIAFLFPLPGGLGVLEASQVFIMRMFANNPALGISISIIMRARDLLIGLVTLLVGLLLPR